MIHDVLFATVIVAGRFTGVAQSVVWMLFELSLFYTICKLDIFKSCEMKWRQILVEGLFTLLSVAAVFATWLGHREHGQSMAIVLISFVILVVDITYVIVEVFRFILRRFKHLKRSAVSVQQIDKVKENPDLMSFV